MSVRAALHAARKKTISGILGSQHAMLHETLYDDCVLFDGDADDVDDNDGNTNELGHKVAPASCNKCIIRHSFCARTNMASIRNERLVRCECYPECLDYRHPIR